MFAESVSIWASVNSWFTPTTFFVVLNLMIGTIYITSTLASPSAATAHHAGDTDGGEGARARARPEIARSPSVLQRLRSAGFYAARSEEPTTVLFADRHQQALGSDFPQFQNTSGGDDVTVGSRDLQGLGYADGSEESAAIDRHRQPLDSSAGLNSDFPQFRNPSGDDDVTIRSQTLRRLGYADGSEESATVSADRRLQPLDSDFPQFQSPSGDDDVTVRSPIQQKLSYADRSEESATVFADRHLDLSARFDSVFPQFQNPRNDHVTVQPVGLGDCAPPAEFAVAGDDSGEPPAEIEPEVARDLGASFEEARGHVARSKSDTKPNLGDPAPRLARKMRKSASLKSAFSHFREEGSSAVEARRPATARVSAPPPPEADEGVDAKADDFINRFKQQLKLQRMDSITRYKEMIGRNSIHK